MTFFTEARRNRQKYCLRIWSRPRLI